MHVGKKHYLCPEVFVDNCELRKVNKLPPGITNLEDVFVGDFEMENVQCEKYLGDTINNHINNKLNLEKSADKEVV